MISHTFPDLRPVSYTPTDIESVVSNGQCKIYWNFAFVTRLQIQANKPDLVLQDVHLKVVYVVEFSCPAETNVTL